MKKLSVFFFIVFSIKSFSFSQNTFGQIGYINIPSAYNSAEGYFGLALNRNEPDRRVSIFASPFSWLDANLFYVDITGKSYGSGFNQSYKDKGFSFKISSPAKIFGHKFALGMNDIAGTGYFNYEYIVASNNFYNLEYSFGLGWGNFSNGIKTSNPLIKIDESFRSRSSGTRLRGGAFDLNNYFSGKDSSLFFGAKYRLNNRNKLFLEYDPLDTSRINYPEPKYKFNIGYERDIDDLSVKISFIRGSNLNFQFSYVTDFLAHRQNKNPIIRSNNSSYSKLQEALALNDMGLMKVEETKESLRITTRQSKYHNQKDVNKIIFHNAKLLAKNKDYIEVVYKSYDMNVYKGKFNNDSEFYTENLDADLITKGLKDKYIVNEKFPIINQTLSPRIRNFIASREAFYHGGLLIEHDLSMLLRENVQIISNLKYSLYDNFDNLIYPPVDTYPNQVRSDVKKYLNNLNSGISVGRFELNSFHQFRDNNFFRLSVGIFEEMFGGSGIEYLYYPQDSLVGLGFEAYYVKKRAYSLNHKFLNYENTFFRSNFQLIEPKTGINLKLSYGEYLAGDIGYTLELSRLFSNGVEFGVFYSDTNVSPELFGEGSFDKGIKLTIPFSFLSDNNSLGKYTWRPLTKDPAALLVKSIDLIDMVRKYRKP